MSEMTEETCIEFRGIPDECGRATWMFVDKQLAQDFVDGKAVLVERDTLLTILGALSPEAADMPEAREVARNAVKALLGGNDG